MTSYDSPWPILTIVVGLGGWVLGTGLRGGSMVSPFSMFTLILVSIFGVRPLLMPGERESFELYGYYLTTQGFHLAALAGFLGTLFFVLGYFVQRLWRGRPVFVAPPAPGPEFDLAPRRSITAAWLLLAVWPVALAMVGGGFGFLRLVFAGRSEAVSIQLAHVPAIVFALPVVSCLTIAAVRFQYERRYAYTRVQNLHYWIVGAVAVVPPSALGTRRFLISSFVIVVVGALGRSWRRKVKPVWLAAGAAGLLALAIFPFVRSAGSRAGGNTDLLGAMVDYFQEEGLRGTLNNFFLSYDTEMFNYLAHFGPRMGSTIPWGLGRGTLGDVIAQPIPAAISPLPIWNDYLLTYAFGGGCRTDVACPVPSVVSVLFTDLAWPGVILGMFILGLMAARFEGSLLQASGNWLAVLLLTAGFSVVFARGNSMSQPWYALQIFVVWWIVQKWVLRCAKNQGKVPYAPPRKRKPVPA